MGSFGSWRAADSGFLDSPGVDHLGPDWLVHGPVQCTPNAHWELVLPSDLSRTLVTPIPAAPCDVSSLPLPGPSSPWGCGDGWWRRSLPLTAVTASGGGGSSLAVAAETWKAVAAATSTQLTTPIPEGAWKPGGRPPFPSSAPFSLPSNSVAGREAESLPSAPLSVTHLPSPGPRCPQQSPFSLL